MRQIIILFALTIGLASTATAQQQTNEIIVEGSAKMKVNPDVVVFTFTMEKADSSEKRAINKLNIAIDGLEKTLNKIGFSNNAIRISDYDVSSTYLNGSSKKTYTASNVLKLEFQVNNKLIDAIYNKIQQAGIEDLEIDFDRKLSDSLERVSRVKLVQLAIENAKANAKNIANALEIKLGKIKQVQKAAVNPITLKPEQTRFTVPDVAAATDMKYKTAFDKFEIEQIELDEQISVIYEIAASAETKIGN
jgi:uncharacterized protein YggE